ncbi:hypothetical protein BaRGS_00030316, partial [Batillaria attramentaria]
TPRRVDNTPQWRLFRAIENGDTETLDSMLESLGTHNVLSMELNGDSLLHIAVRNRKPEIVKLLLEYNADASSTDYSGRRVLEVAVSENLAEIAKIVISHGSDPVKIFEKARVWLKYAREKGLDEMAAALEDLTESFDQHDPEFKLYKAIILNNHTLIVDLLEQHVDPFAVKLGTVDTHGRVDAKDTAGQTPLHYAAAKNSVENNGKQAEDVCVSPPVKRMLSARRTSVPDVIIAMRGEWFRELPRADCTLSRSPHQPSDKDLPTVLMFRCITEDARDEEEWAQFERSSFHVDELCLEVYEYRCSEPGSPVQFLIDLRDRDLDAEKLKLVLKHRPKDGAESSEELTVSENMAAGCEVALSTSGHVAVVCQDWHRVVTVPVGKEETNIQPQELPGLKLQIPQDTFTQTQNILIKAEQPPPLPSIIDNTELPDNREEPGPSNEEDMAVIKTLSCFYNIVNTGSERPHKSMLMSIPMKTKTDNVVTLFLKQPGLENQDEGPSHGIEKLEIEEKVPESSTHHGLSGQQQQDREPPDGASPLPDDDANPDSYSDDEFDDSDEEIDVSDQPAWIASSDVIVNQEQAVISTDLTDMGVVVAAEVRPGVTSEELIKTIHALYSQKRKKEILIFTMAKAAPGNTAEVMVCCVSEERHQPAISRFEDQGYQCLREPMVAYASSRETFRLKLKGNLKNIYAEAEFSIVEYQVGGRLNYTTLVLEVQDKSKPATGAIVVARTTHDNSQYPDVGTLYLDLTSLLPEDTGSATGDQLSTVDIMVLKLSETMSTDSIRVYCYALGMTKDAMKTIQGKSLSPSEEKFR